MNDSRMKKRGLLLVLQLYCMPSPLLVGLGFGFAFPGISRRRRMIFGPMRSASGEWEPLLCWLPYSRLLSPGLGETAAEMDVNCPCYSRFGVAVIMGIYLFRPAVSASGWTRSVGPDARCSRCKPHGGVGILLVCALSGLGISLGIAAYHAGKPDGGKWKSISLNNRK